MSTERDDDALSWGDDDPTLDAGTRLPAGYVAVGTGSESVSTADPDSPVASDAPVPSGGGAGEGGASTDADTVAPESGTSTLSNTVLVILGVFAGIYALESIGWIIGGLRLRTYAEYLIAPGAYQVSLWLAVLTPLIWFLTVLFVTRGGRSWVRILLLLAGALLVLPWPFIMVGAIGS